MHTADQNPDGSASNMQSEFVFRSLNCLAERRCHAAFCPRPGVPSRIRQARRIPGQFRHILLHNSCFDFPCPAAQAARNVVALIQRETRINTEARTREATARNPPAGHSPRRKMAPRVPGLLESTGVTNPAKSTIVTCWGGMRVVDDARRDNLWDSSPSSPLEQPGPPACREVRARLPDFALDPWGDLPRQTCSPGSGRSLQPWE